MKLQDLKTGMLIKTREGDVYKVYLGTASTDSLCQEDGKWLDVDSYKDDMTHVRWSDFDIVEVYDCKNPCYFGSFKINDNDLIWEREDVQELTMTELNELLVKLGYGKKVKIIQ